MTTTVTKRRKPTRPPALLGGNQTGIAATGVHVLLDLLGPVTAADVKAARTVIARQQKRGSVEAAELSPLLEAYFAGRAAS